ncbi:Purine nucleoside phosphorylase 1 [subsurface metagenome]
MIMSLREKIAEAKKFIESRSKVKPKIGIIVGTGLGTLAKEIEIKAIVPYSDIPHFAVSTAPGHEGNLILGKLSGKMIMAMQGRFHLYEGYSLEEITFPIRIMKEMGVELLIESNVAGGMNPNFKAGDLMIVTDHINLTGNNPLIGPNDERLGPRFPDMSEPYDKKLIELTNRIAIEEKIGIHQGVYVGLTGPNFETPAEYRFLRLIGADAVGMSTVCEVIVARHSGLRVLGMSCITDECIPDRLEPVNFRKLIQVAQKVEPNLARLVKRLLREI